MVLSFGNLSGYKIVVTGYNGFLGKNLLARMKGSELLLIGREPSMIGEIPKFTPDFIFHFGGEIYDDNKMLESNIILTQKMLEVTKQINFKAFIYCGSSSEYGFKNVPMSETHVLEPRNLYEATKGAGSLLCQAYAKMYQKPIYVIRPFTVYGRHDREHKFLPTLFHAFEQKTGVTLYPGTHDWIYVDDFIDAVILIAKTQNPTYWGGVFNIGTGIQHSNKEVYDTMAQVFGYEVPLEIKDTLLRPYDSQNWVANVSKIKTTHGFSVTCSLREGIERMYHERTYQHIK